MKIKEIFKELLSFGIGFSIGYFTSTSIRARSFKNSLNINLDSLDVVSYLNNLKVKYGKQDITDFKIGCFIGTLTCNLENLIFTNNIYDLTVVISQGVVTLYIPKDVNVNITSVIPGSKIINYHHNHPENRKVLAINSEISFGILIIKTCED